MPRSRNDPLPHDSPRMPRRPALRSTLAFALMLASGALAPVLAESGSYRIATPDGRLWCDFTERKG